MRRDIRFLKLILVLVKFLMILTRFVFPRETFLSGILNNWFLVLGPRSSVHGTGRAVTYDLTGHLSETRLDKLKQRTQLLVSRIPYPVSRIPYPVSRIPYHKKEFSCTK